MKITVATTEVTSVMKFMGTPIRAKSPMVYPAGAETSSCVSQLPGVAKLLEAQNMIATMKVSGFTPMFDAM